MGKKLSFLFNITLSTRNAAECRYISETTIPGKWNCVYNTNKVRKLMLAFEILCNLKESIDIRGSITWFTFLKTSIPSGKTNFYKSSSFYASIFKEITSFKLMPNLRISIWVVHFRKWQPQKTPAVTNMFQKTFLHDTKKTLIILSSWKRQIQFP